MIYIHHQKKGDIWFGVALENNLIVATSFNKDEEAVLKSILRNIPFNRPFQFTEEKTDLSRRVIETMKKVYDGEDVSRSFNFYMDHLTPFTRRVLQCVHLIPIGYVASYGGIAKAVGVPKGGRAVGNVMAKNPFAPLIPCHRVVYSNLKLGGYGGGLDLKLELLKKEDRGYVRPVILNFFDEPLELFPIKCLLL